MSSYNPFNSPAYLEELTQVLSNPALQRKMSVRILSKRWKVGKYMCFDAINPESCKYRSTTHIDSAFGSFDFPSLGPQTPRPLLESESIARWRPRQSDIWVRERNGIEILKAQPNATGRTYSRACRITVPELKEACKQNGIKTAGKDKRALLHALMKL